MVAGGTDSSRKEPGLDRLSRYRLLGLIGSGGMGSVYLAEDPALGRRVAVKVLAEDLARRPEQRARFLREARAAAQVSSPWVVSIHEIGDASGVPFIVMEYIEGKPLSEILAAEGKLPIETSEEVIRQVALALSAAHEKGVLHRDIKPENILIAADGRACVTDFGIAKITDASVLTRTGEIMGTAAYMAPEQALGEVIDARSDLYSLGCLAYEILTGRPPFEAESPVGLVYRHVNEEPAPPSGDRPEVPPYLEAVVLKLLAKAPGDRYPSAGEVARAVEAGRGAELAPRDVAPPAVPKDAGTPVRPDAVRFIGRTRELDSLKSILHRAIGGRGAVRFIAGEAGVGKTRLVQELERYARRRGVRFLKGACLYQEGTIPYLPFISAIRCYFRLARRDTNRAEREAIKQLLRREAPELRALIPQVGTFIGQPASEGRPMDLEDRPRERERLFESICELIEKISEHRPLVLFLDDLQWADRGSLRLLHYVASGCQDRPVLLVGAYRIEELRGGREGAEQSLLDTIQRLGREDLSETMRLDRFSRTEVGQLIGSLLPGGEMDGELVKRLHRETLGNPLFVLELVTLLKQEGTLVQDGGAWHWASGQDPVRIPSRVRDVLARRVDRLSADDRSLLECAAVAGDPFDAGLVSRVLGRRKIDLLRDLQPLEKQYRMIRCEDDGFHFDHPKLQEVLYEEIPQEMRRELHRLVAQEVEGMSLPPEQRVFGLARHYYRAGEYDRAYPVLVAAAAEARRLYAYEDRDVYLRQALETSAKSEVRREDDLRLLVDLGETDTVLGSWDEADGVFDRALALARELGERRTEARVLGGIAFGCFKRSRWQRAMERYEDSLAVYEELEDFRGIGECQIGMGNVAFESGDWERARAGYRIALEVGDRRGLEQIRARASNNLGAVANACGRHEEAIEWYEKGLACFQHVGDELGSARAFHNLGMTYLDLECWGEAESLLRQSLAISTRMRQPDLMSITLLLIGDLLLRRGQLGEARDSCLRALAIFKRRGDRPGEADALRILGSVSAAEGSLEEAEEHFGRSLEINVSCGQRLQSAETERELGRLHMKKHDPGNAARYLERASREFRELGALRAARLVDEDLRQLTGV